MPSDLADVDSCRWDKFIVYLKIKDGHPRLGGAEIKFDTYRHGKIEDWILAMERTAFPERVAEEEAAAARAKERAARPRPPSPPRASRPERRDPLPPSHGGGSCSSPRV